MDIATYLERIGYRGGTEPTLETLRGMHRAHFYSVPFENLDVSRGVRIAVDEAVNVEKIVGRRRGGFCLELTGLFGRVLREMGFRVDVIGARVMMDGVIGRTMAHMVLIVHLDEPWIADVGFGGRVIEPLPLRDGAELAVGERRYAVTCDGDHWFVTCNEPNNSPGAYFFTLTPRAFDEFLPVCDWLQTSPASRFTKGDIASLATPNGRVTLANRRLIVADGDRRDEAAIASNAEYGTILRDRFGIALAAGGSG